jgi:hypothetical protein
MKPASSHEATAPSACGHVGDRNVTWPSLSLGRGTGLAATYPATSRMIKVSFTMPVSIPEYLPRYRDHILVSAMIGSKPVNMTEGREVNRAQVVIQ